MLINLVTDVLVRKPGGDFITAPSGTPVNYRSHKRPPDHMVHTFSFMHRGVIYDHTCVTFLNDKPEWL